MSSVSSVKSNLLVSPVHAVWFVWIREVSEKVYCRERGGSALAAEGRKGKWSRTLLEEQTGRGAQYPEPYDP